MRSVEEILAEIEKRMVDYEIEQAMCHNSIISRAELYALRHFILSGPPECEHLTYDMCLHDNDIVSNKCIKCGKVL